MAEPLGRGLRAARGSGLTSPEPVSTPTAATATQNPVPEAGTQDKPQNRRAAGRSHPESPRQTPRAGIKPETSYQNWPVDRGLAPPGLPGLSPPAARPPSTPPSATRTPPSTSAKPSNPRPARGMPPRDASAGCQRPRWYHRGRQGVHGGTTAALGKRAPRHGYCPDSSLSVRSESVFLIAPVGLPSGRSRDVAPDLGDVGVLPGRRLMSVDERVSGTADLSQAGVPRTYLAELAGRGTTRVWECAWPGRR